MKNFNKIMLLGLLTLLVVPSCGMLPTPTIGSSNNTGQSSSNENQVIVTFDSKGGTYIPPQTLEKGSFITKPSDPEIYAGEFINWYYEDESIHESYVWLFSNYVVNRDITLIAKWEMATPTIKVLTYEHSSYWPAEEAKLSALTSLDTKHPYFTKFENEYAERSNCLLISDFAPSLYNRSYEYFWDKFVNIAIVEGFVKDGSTDFLYFGQGNEYYYGLTEINKENIDKAINSGYSDTIDVLKKDGKNYYLPFRSFEGTYLDYNYQTGKETRYEGTWIYFLVVLDPVVLNDVVNGVDKFDNLRLEASQTAIGTLFDYFQN